MGELYATTISLKELMEKVLPPAERVSIDMLLRILDHEDKGAVSEEDFFSVMKPWASFSATDINGDNQLDVAELKTLIWLLNEEEPTEYRVQRDLKAIDADQNGHIDRFEWIQYLAIPDSGGENTFNFALKRAFDMHDQDKDGLINVDDLFELIKSTMQELTKGKSSETKKMIEKLERALAVDIMNTLDEKKSGHLDWSHFKRYMDVAKDKEEKLKEFVESNT